MTGNLDKYETLHCHSRVSDGILSYEEIINVCGKHNIGVVAFTDHDSLPNNNSYKRLLSLNDRPTKWIIGIEISADKPKDFTNEFSPHLVGLFVDPFNKELVQHCKIAQESRKQRMVYMVKHLKELGFSISENDCLKVSKGEAVGRPHIVEALKSKADNLDIIEQLRRKMEVESSHSAKIKRQYDEMMRRGEEQYPYVLFMSDDSYVKGVYQDYLYRIDLDKCVEIIRKAGGVAIFAHWFTDIKKCGEDGIEKLLSEDRIDGVETVYGFYDDIKNDFIEQRRILKNLVKKFHKLEGGGVDAHTEEHLINFSNNKWYAGLTIGLTEKIIRSNKVDKKWSAFK